MRKIILTTLRGLTARSGKWKRGKDLPALFLRRHHSSVTAEGAAQNGRLRAASGVPPANLRTRPYTRKV